MLAGRLARTARRFGGRPAVIQNERVVTYGQLLARTSHVKRACREAGLMRGDVVALLLPNSADFVASFFAVASLGAVGLPLSPSLTLTEVAAAVQQSKCALIITDGRRSDTATARWALTQPGLRAVVLEDSATADRSQVEGADELPRDDEHGPAVIQFSSGSTGVPRRVCRTQAALLAESDAFARAIGLRPEDTILCTVPLGHAHAFGKCMIAGMTSGATVILLDEPEEAPTSERTAFVFQATHALDLVRRYGVSIVPGVPHIFAALADAPDDRVYDTSSLRLCLSGGAPLLPEIFERFKARFGVPIRCLYGSTETGSLAVNMEPDHEVTYDSVGRPSPGVDIRITTGGSLDPLPPETTGDVVARSPGMADGYPDDPAATAAQFVNGFFFTGDIGHFDADGRLYVTGRTKNFIESGGEKVDPFEVERVLIGHPRVAEAAVVAVPLSRGDHAIKAVIVARGELHLTELAQFCAERLAPYKVPRSFELRSALPRTPLGKIIRQELIQTPLDRSESSTGGRSTTLTLADELIHCSPAHRHQVLQARLRHYLADMLNLSSVDVAPDRPLADFGLSSAMAIELIGWLESQLRLDLPVTSLWSYPTVAELADHVIARLDGGSPVGGSPPVSQPAAAQVTDSEDLADVSDAQVQQQLTALIEHVLADVRTTDQHRG